MATLSIKALGKTYPGAVTAVSDVDAEIADGEFVVLVGPSGCGKSTMLRMIAGLETISTGDLRIGDRRVNDVEPGARNIAMVFQNYALYPHMTVRKNMSYGLRNEGLPRRDIDARIAEAARSLRLEPYLDRKPRQLSGGQRQRVAMGRAIVRDPAVFLFDEPLSNLDAKLRTQLRGELKTLHHRLGATFIYVTHDQVEAMSLADRIILMNAGRVEQIGTPLDLYHRPETQFVADFIGSPSMNFFDGTLGTDGAKFVFADGATIGLGDPIASAPTSAPGHRVTLGIRPEHLVLSPEGALPLTVTYHEQLGADTLVHGTLQGTANAMALRLDGTRAFVPGDTLWCAVQPENIHVFDAQTKRRLSRGYGETTMPISAA